MLAFTYTAISQNSYIQLVCEPNVSVSVDGTEKGLTTKEVGGIILEGLTPGQHKLSLSKKGFIAQSGTVRLKDGEVESDIINENPIY